jgi:hypothetical protein
MPFAFSPWDLALLAVVTAMGTLLAYLPDPRWKAFLLSLPFPFTLANLSLGEPIGSSHALGLWSLLLFVHLVRWLHYGLRLPILAAIALPAGLNLALGAALNHLVPRTGWIFWAALGPAVAAGAVLLRVLPRRREPAHRSPMPVAVKLAAIAGLVALLVLLKRALGGFMTMFPMVATIAAYEARHSLHTIGRQVPVVMVTMGPMMAAMWLLQRAAGVSAPLSLLAGWGVFLALLVPIIVVLLRAAGPSELPQSE